jgi:hypothetical protein
MEASPNGVINAHTIENVTSITGFLTAGVDTIIQTQPGSGNDIEINTDNTEEITINTGYAIVNGALQIVLNGGVSSQLTMIDTAGAGAVDIDTNSGASHFSMANQAVSLTATDSIAVTSSALTIQPTDARITGAGLVQLQSVNGIGGGGSISVDSNGIYATAASGNCEMAAGAGNIGMNASGTFSALMFGNNYNFNGSGPGAAIVNVDGDLQLKGTNPSVDFFNSSNVNKGSLDYVELNDKITLSCSNITIEATPANRLIMDTGFGQGMIARTHGLPIALVRYDAIGTTAETQMTIETAGQVKISEFAGSNATLRLENSGGKFGQIVASETGGFMAVQAESGYSLTMESTGGNVNISAAGAGTIDLSTSNNSLTLNGSTGDTTWTAGGLATLGFGGGTSLNTPNFSADVNGNGYAAIGDLQGNNNFTRMIINDSAGTIELFASNGNILIDTPDLRLSNVPQNSGTAHNVQLKANTTGLDIENYLKVRYNAADIWIPYLTTDPSV